MVLAIFDLRLSGTGLVGSSPLRSRRCLLSGAGISLTLRLVSPSRFLVSTKPRSFLSLDFRRRRSAGKNSSFLTRTMSPTRSWSYLASSSSGTAPFRWASGSWSISMCRGFFFLRSESRGFALEYWAGCSSSSTWGWWVL